MGVKLAQIGGSSLQPSQLFVSHENSLPCFFYGNVEKKKNSGRKLGYASDRSVWDKFAPYKQGLILLLRLTGHFVAYALHWH